jgi:hypothetical protein
VIETSRVPFQTISQAALCICERRLFLEPEQRSALGGLARQPCLLPFPLLDHGRGRVFVIQAERLVFSYRGVVQRLILSSFEAPLSVRERSGCHRRGQNGAIIVIHCLGEAPTCLIT